MSTLAATWIVAALTPYRPGELRGCGMDASFTLSNLALWFFIVRWSWRALKFLQATLAGCFAGADRPGPDLTSTPKPHQA